MIAAWSLSIPIFTVLTLWDHWWCWLWYGIVTPFSSTITCLATASGQWLVCGWVHTCITKENSSSALFLGFASDCHKIAWWLVIFGQVTTIFVVLWRDSRTSCLRYFVHWHMVAVRYNRQCLNSCGCDTIPPKYSMVDNNLFLCSRCL